MQAVEPLKPHVVTVKEVAVSLFREGRFADAREVLSAALASLLLLTENEFVTLKLCLALVEQWDGNHTVALDILLRDIAPRFDQLNDFALVGRCYNSLAYSYRRLDRRDDAIEALTAASIYHEQAGEKALRSETENNLGNLLVDAGRYEDAQEHFEQALKGCDDEFAISQILESRASAYLANKEPHKALPHALQSVELLRQTDRTPWLKESLSTLAKVCEELAKQYRLEEERPQIEAALRAAGGHITPAARALGMNSGTLNWKLENQHPMLLHLRAPKKKPRGRHVLQQAGS